MASRRKSVIAAILSFLLWYLLWGLLDEAGGVKGLFVWIGASGPSLNAPSVGCVPTLYGCQHLPNWVALVLLIPLVFLNLILLLDYLFRSIAKGEWEENQHIKEAIREVLDERELAERRRKDTGKEG